MKRYRFNRRYRRTMNLSSRFKPNEGFTSNEDGQLIVSMGVILIFSIFAIAFITAEISELDVVIPFERSTSLTTEYFFIREAFGTSLNYNLVNVSEENSIMYGDIENIIYAFAQTRDEFFSYELKHGNFFDASLVKLDVNGELQDYCFSHTSTSGYNIWFVEVLLHLENSETSIEETNRYYITCKTYTG